jgi:hypothetical protein
MSDRSIEAGRAMLRQLIAALPWCASAGEAIAVQSVITAATTRLDEAEAGRGSSFSSELWTVGHAAVEIGGYEGPSCFASLVASACDDIAASVINANDAAKHIARADEEFAELMRAA